MALGVNRGQASRASTVWRRALLGVEDHELAGLWIPADVAAVVQVQADLHLRAGWPLVQHRPPNLLARQTQHQRRAQAIHLLNGADLLAEIIDEREIPLRLRANLGDLRHRFELVTIIDEGAQLVELGPKIRTPRVAIGERHRPHTLHRGSWRLLPDRVAGGTVGPDVAGEQLRELGAR